MRYTYKEGIKKERSRKWVFMPIVGLVGGFYMLVNVFSPAVLYVIEPTDTTAKKLTSLQPALEENRVFIPKINVDVPVVPIEGDEQLALEKGAVQRSPSSGDPKSGGNFVLAAHRFNLGFTPQQTRAKSPFYYMNRINVEDDIYVDYKGTRYAYRVTEKKLVDSDAVEIEEKTDDNRLTMYTCELAGPEAGREVVIAKPIGKIVWSSGQARLQGF